MHLPPFHSSKHNQNLTIAQKVENAKLSYKD